MRMKPKNKEVWESAQKNWRTVFEDEFQKIECQQNRDEILKVFKKIKSGKVNDPDDYQAKRSGGVWESRTSEVYQTSIETHETVKFSVKVIINNLDRSYSRFLYLLNL